MKNKDTTLDIENERMKNMTPIFEERATDSLNSQDLSDLIISTRNWFWMAMWDDEIIDHVSSGKFILTISNGEKLIGFSSIIDRFWIPYLMGIAIHSEYQKKGIYTQLHKDILQKKYQQILLRTQNKNVIQWAKKAGWQVFIWSEAWNQMKDVVDNELFINECDGKNFKDGVFEGAYGAYLWSSDRVNYIDETMYPGFQAARGDSLLVLLRMPKA